MAMGRPASDGVSYDPAAHSKVEKRFWRDLWQTAVSDAVVDERIDLARFGPVLAGIVGEEPEEPMLNFVLGAAEPGAVADGHLVDAIEWVESHGVGYRVPVTPGLAGAGAAEDWLNRNGYERSAGWRTFVRDVAPPKFSDPPGLEVYEMTDSEIESGFPDMMSNGFEMPCWGATFFFGLPDRDTWRCYVVVDDSEEEHVSSAAMLIERDVALLVLADAADVAPSEDGHAALLRHGVADATEAGCHSIFVEIPERLSTSDQSLRRAGFKAACLRPDWRLPRLAAASY